ncbi:MAG: hypothetical protein QM793_14190 [Muricomes sp.]
MGFRSLAEVDRLTIPEYTLLMEAHSLKMVDDEYRRHEQAFLNYQVQAQKSSGKGRTKPVYDRFEKFFDYEKALDTVKKKVKKPAERFTGIGKFLRKGGE